MHSGLTVGDRFVLIELEAEIAADTTRWRATDTRLGREVTLLVGEGTAAAKVASAGMQARGVRDAHLARIVTVLEEIAAADLDDEPANFPDTSDSLGPVADSADMRAIVAIERPEGVRLTDIAADRLIPVEVARAVVAQAASAHVAADTYGLDAPGGTPDLTVTPTGRVVIAGAGFGSLFSTKSVGVGSSLIQWFGDSVARADEEAEGLTAGEIGMLADARAGRTVSLETLIERLGSVRNALRGLAVGATTFESRVPPLTASETLPVTDTVAEDRALLGQETLTENTLVEDADISAPDHARTPADDMWEFDRLVEDQLAEAGQTPTVSETLLAFLQRKFPRSEGVAAALERAHARALAGPRIHSAWIFLGLTVGLVVTWQFAWNWAQSPYQPDIDLKNNPPQHWPEFTRGHDPSPSTDAP